MIFYRKGIKHIYAPSISKTNSNTFISVVVCFRNEEQNLPMLLKGLIEQHYPATNFEILLYNDASTDGSLALIKNIQAQFKSHQFILKDVKIKQGCNSPKKLAINDAAANSRADLMVVTDADCILNKDWLSLIESCYVSQKAFLIAAPVVIKPEANFINELQGIEMQALTAVTAGAIGNKKALMCNGANLAFDRKTFLSLDPFKYNHHISSGDDMFLLMSMQEVNANKIEFLAHSNAVVHTNGKTNLSSYINQRIRWTSKSKHYEANGIKIVALLVLNMNAVLLFSPLVFLAGNLYAGALLFISILLIKQLADTICMTAFANKMQIKVNYSKLLLYQYLEAALTLLVALKSIKGSYVWKERKQHF